ncbi:fimbrial protein [Enterobacter kobei]|nr:fimbrial protein [Enterobacter kobei]
MNISKFKLMIILLGGVYSSFAVSNVKENTASVTFHGTLIVVECNVNGGKRQIIDFGDAVGVHRINGSNYEQTVPFSLECHNYAGGNMPRMSLEAVATPTSFNESAIATDVSGLGIEIRNNGKPIKLNTAIDINYDNQPILTAVPVADPSVELEAKPFTATVKLTVEIP